MATKETVNKWLELVDEDLSVAQDLYKTKHWLYTAFMCHQVIEKSLKEYLIVPEAKASLRHIQSLIQ